MSFAQEFAEIAAARGINAVVRRSAAVRPELVGPARPLIYGRVRCTSRTCHDGFDRTSARDCGVCHGRGYITTMRVGP